MTQKHFIAIAQALVDAYPHWETYHSGAAYKDLIKFCIDLCKANGARFDQDKFLSYLRSRGIRYE